MSELPRDFPQLLRKAIDWASDIEAQVLESGTELGQDQLLDARLAGVKEPARIRVLVSETIPMPDDPALLAGNEKTGILSENGKGIALGYAVIIRAGCEGARRLLVHEFVHVAQFERMGGMDRFLREYITQIIRAGYENAPLENEAEQRTDSIVGRQ